MKIRLNTIYASPSGRTAHPGQVIDLDPAEAKQLLAAGYAAESADTAAPENASRSRKARKPRASAEVEQDESPADPDAPAN